MFNFKIIIFNNNKMKIIINNQFNNKNYNKNIFNN